MANVLTITAIQPLDRFKIVRYNCVLSGNYVQVANGGEVLTLNSALNPSILAGGYWGLTGPSFTQGRLGTGYPLQGPGGLAAEIFPGVDGLHPILKLFDPTTGNELATGPYPAKVTVDTQFNLAFEGKLTD